MSFSDFGRSMSNAARGSRGRLKAKLLRLFTQAPQTEYTPQHLFLLVKPPSPDVLALVLDELEKNGVVTRVFRVESPTTHGGIRDFNSIDEIPPIIHDWTTDEDIEVGPELIRSVFKPQRA
jgi:hypothetical protein